MADSCLCQSLVYYLMSDTINALKLLKSLLGGQFHDLAVSLTQLYEEGADLIVWLSYRRLSDSLNVSNWQSSTSTNKSGSLITPSKSAKSIYTTTPLKDDCHSQGSRLRLFQHDHSYGVV